MLRYPIGAPLEVPLRNTAIEYPARGKGQGTESVFLGERQRRGSVGAGILVLCLEIPKTRSHGS